jgi:hypothetical protein
MHEGSLLLKILQHKYAHLLAHEETPEGHIQLTLFALSYLEAVSIVTYTEPTMIAAGRIFVQWSLKEGGRTKWLGCIENLLQLVTLEHFLIYPCQKGHSRHVKIS